MSLSPVFEKLLSETSSPNGEEVRRRIISELHRAFESGRHSGFKEGYQRGLVEGIDLQDYYLKEGETLKI